MSTYDKPHLTYEQQLSRLEERGLIVDDRAQALWYLSTVGYYALGGYLYTMRKLEGGERQDTFIEGASFTSLVALVEFDRSLRGLCLEALEVIERTVKVRTAYVVGKLDHLAHETGSLHNADVKKRDGRGQSEHEKWCATHNSKIEKRRHDSVPSFVAKHGKPLPIWVAIDVMDFGDISHLVGHLGRKQQTAIAREFGLHRGVDFASWVRTMCCLRNMAAHHERMWNREIAVVPKKARPPESDWFAEVLDDERWWSRTYVVLLIIARFITHIDPATDWPSRMGQLLCSLPVGVGVHYASLGAPDEWLLNPIWGLD